MTRNRGPIEKPTNPHDLAGTGDGRVKCSACGATFRLSEQGRAASEECVTAAGDEAELHGRVPEVHSPKMDLEDMARLDRQMERLSISTATGADLDRLSELVCPRQPVPLKDGEEPPPLSSLSLPPPAGFRWESDAELRKRALAQHRVPGFGKTWPVCKSCDAVFKELEQDCCPKCRDTQHEVKRPDLVVTFDGDPLVPFDVDSVCHDDQERCCGDCFEPKPDLLTPLVNAGIIDLPPQVEHEGDSLLHRLLRIEPPFDGSKFEIPESARPDPVELAKLKAIEERMRREVQAMEEAKRLSDLEARVEAMEAHAHEHSEPPPRITNPPGTMNAAMVDMRRELTAQGQRIDGLHSSREAMERAHHVYRESLEHEASRIGALEIDLQSLAKVEGAAVVSSLVTRVRDMSEHVGEVDGALTDRINAMELLLRSRVDELAALKQEYRQVKATADEARKQGKCVALNRKDIDDSARDIRGFVNRLDGLIPGMNTATKMTMEPLQRSDALQDLVLKDLAARLEKQDAIIAALTDLASRAGWTRPRDR